MKYKIALFAFALVALPAMSPAQYREARMGDLIRYERLRPPEAATMLMLSRSLGLEIDYILRERRIGFAQIWDLVPAFYIANNNRMSVREVWDRHTRGEAWVDIGRYSEDRTRRYGDNGSRRRRQGDDRRNDYRRDRQERDDAFVQRIWESMLARAFDSRTQTWEWTRNGLNPGDLAMCAYIEQLTGVSADEVCYEQTRRHDWESIRRYYGISADWERRESRRYRR